ncbi:hypothetical protein [Butyrivibrio sp. FCS014]|uniref:hypothetical protein n=1 Tax=Butyrivibrio sp. FCS014 TaxID=1408304 RepID=UPI000467E0A5|nr:hypothetical protein [Butyrivibrio sp. FCS014]
MPVNEGPYSVSYGSHQYLGEPRERMRPLSGEAMLDNITESSLSTMTSTALFMRFPCPAAGIGYPL